MAQAEITTSWTTRAGIDGTERVTSVEKNYALNYIQDITGQRVENIVPDPNVVVVKVQASAAVLDQITADGVDLVNWRDDA